MAEHTPHEVANWIIKKVKEKKLFKRENILNDISEVFGNEYLTKTKSGKKAISSSVLKAFRKKRSTNIRWDAKQHGWVYENNRKNGSLSGRKAEGFNASLPVAVNPRPVPKNANLDHPSLYFNKELGWLDFNWRVFYQAMDERLPLLERVKFIAITASNLDEFIQKRVGGLKRQKVAGVIKLTPDGRGPSDQIQLISQNTSVMYSKMSALWNDVLRPQLYKEAEVKISDYEELSKSQKHALDNFFMNRIYPILTPLAVDPGHPFPFISNLSLSLAVVLKYKHREATHFARVKIPSNQPRWVKVADPDHQFHFVLIEDIIKHNIDKLFPGMEIKGVYTFRVTRNADVRRDEEEAEDLLDMISEELRERRFANVVRLEVEENMAQHVLDILKKELALDNNDVFKTKGLLDLTSLFSIAGLNIPQLRFDPWDPVTPRRFKHEGEAEDELNIFEIIKKGDILVHHPYESFATSVQRLVEEAAHDPDVIAIKQTLYRTSDNSPIVNALLKAVEKGKQVAVLIEVKARFDEANNIEWGQMLENAGVHVTYGLVGLKTHTKTLLVIRREKNGPVTYCHIGTGNYHAQTARLYTDLGLLTNDEDIGFDMINLFHYLTGYAPSQHYRKLVIAPRDMRKKCYEMIDNEMKAQKEGKGGKIIVKMNALDDFGIIQKLYEASQNGVQIDCIIRGHSILRPGLAGYSDNIRVISIIGRFLEHDRILFFKNHHPQLFIGSADWRSRNMDDRVEALVPLTQPSIKNRIMKILEKALSDNRLAWDLNADGVYTQRKPKPDEDERNFHLMLMDEAIERGKG